MRTCAHRPFRPALEALESREVPATFNWTGAVSTNALDAANWSSLEEPGGLPGEDDHLYFGGLTVVLGEEGGPPSPPSGGSSVNCDNLQSLGNGFAGVHIGAAYTGTVTMGEALAFGVFDLANGAISQSANAYDLIVTGTFNWTGGTLNSGPEAHFFLSGATGNISAGTGNTIATGSALFVNANANVTVGPGTINFVNGSAVTIEGARMLISAEQDDVSFTGPADSYEDGKSKIELKPQGELTIRKINFAPKNRIFVNNGGNLVIKEGATVRFGTNALLGPPAGTPIKTDILQNSGTITVHGGSALGSGFGAMEIKGGALFVAASATETEGTIDCPLFVSAGTIRINTNIGSLRVKQDFYWSGGTFQSTVDCAANGKADKIVAEKKLYVGGTAKVQVLVLNYNANAGLGANFSRVVVQAQVITNVGGLEPSLALENPANGPVFKLSFLPNFPTEYTLVPGPGQN